MIVEPGTTLSPVGIWRQKRHRACPWIIQLGWDHTAGGVERYIFTGSSNPRQRVIGSNLSTEQGAKKLSDNQGRCWREDSVRSGLGGELSS